MTFEQMKSEQMTFEQMKFEQILLKWNSFKQKSLHQITPVIALQMSFEQML